MKKWISLLIVLVLFGSVLSATAESGDDPVALKIDSHEITKSELKSAAVLYLFEAALSCAEYGYGLDILDPLTIEDEMDKLIFDLERWYTGQDLAISKGLYPLSRDAAAAATADAEAAWEHYREIAGSEDGRDNLPGGVYSHREEDPEGNITRYFAYFGLTEEALLTKAIREQTIEELQKAVTATMNGTEEELITGFAEWFVEKIDEAYIEEDQDVIGQVMDELAQDPSEQQDEEGYEAFERSIFIDNEYYILGESTIRDFDQNGWTWTREADGRFTLQNHEEGHTIYARTDNGGPEGKLVMIDLFEAYDLAYEYLGIGFDLMYDPDESSDILTLMEEVYGGEYTDDGICQARTEVRGGTLLIEVAEGALRLTLE